MSGYDAHYLDAHLHIWAFTIKSNKILERIAARPINPMAINTRLLLKRV